MLTNDDLQKIGLLIDNRLDQKLTPIENELKKHGEMLQEQGKELKQDGIELKQHGKLLRSLKNDQDSMLNLLDNEQMKQRKRLDRIEYHLDVPISL